MQRLTMSYCVQMKRNFKFESETDTETIVKLMKHLYDTHKNDVKGVTFRELVEKTIQQLVSQYERP